MLLRTTALGEPRNHRIWDLEGQMVQMFPISSLEFGPHNFSNDFESFANASESVYRFPTFTYLIL